MLTLPWKIDFARLIPAFILAVVITGCGGGSSGSAATAAVAPSISVQPLSISVTEGASASFSVTATGTAPLTYQWQRNGVDVAGATAAQYTLAAVQNSDSGSLWTVSVRNSAGSAASAAAKLTVANKSLLAGSILGNGFNGYAQIEGIAIDDAGNLYLSDRTDDGILRIVNPQGVASKMALTARSGDATAALFRALSLARDSAGNFYVSDEACAIHKISPAGELTTLAGSATCGTADGKGTAATFDFPAAITVDTSANVYVVGGATIRKITPDGTVTTLAGVSREYGIIDGDAKTARFGGMTGIAVDAAGNIYVADASNAGSAIRKLTPDGTVSTLAGGHYGAADGIGTTASFSALAGMTIDRHGNLFVADKGNHTIRKITQAGEVTTLAGKASQLGTQTGWISGQTADGTGPAATVNEPYSLTTDSAGNVYVVESNSGLQVNNVRKITPAGVVTTITGSYAGAGDADGPGASARFFAPRALAVQSDGSLLVADTSNRTIRKVSASGVVTTLAGTAGHGSFLDEGDGTGAAATFAQPSAIVVSADGTAYVADAVRQAIRKVTRDGVVTTLAGGRKTSILPHDGQGAAATFGSTNGIAIDGQGMLYVADYHAVRKVDAAGNVTTLTGGLDVFEGGGSADGTLAQARFGYLTAITADASGNLYLTDSLNQNVRKITPAGVVTTLAGQNGIAGDADGQAGAATFNGPQGIAVDKAGNVYVADTQNNLIRRISTTGVVTTVAGKRGLTGNTVGSPDGALNHPMGLAFDADGVLHVTSSNGIFKLQL